MFSVNPSWVFSFFLPTKHLKKNLPGEKRRKKMANRLKDLKVENVEKNIERRRRGKVKNRNF